MIALLAAGLAAVLMLLLFPGQGTTAGPTVGPIVRLAAQYDKFDGTEFNTTDLPSSNATGGEAIFETTVFPPAQTNVLYVTVTGTGDAHKIDNGCEEAQIGPSDIGTCGQAKIQLACLVSNAPCNAGEGNADADSGWVTLQYPLEDLHDNGITYTWCKAIPTGGAPRHIQVRMASSNGGDVYMETTHFFVDASQLTHGCGQADTPPDQEEPTSAGHNG